MKNDSAPLLPACKLWQRTSASGRTYLVGRLGGLRVLIFERGERDEGDHSHVLMLGAAPSVDKPEIAARMAGGAADGPPHEAPRPEAASRRYPQRGAWQGEAPRRSAPALEPLVDDPIPF